MGRKKISEKKFCDNIGEKVDLEICPCCNEHPDCFSYSSGKCVALKAGGGQDCVFYKKHDQALAENKTIYKKLKENGRIDLIIKYGKFLFAVGAFDDELADASSITVELDNYAEKDYRKQLAREND